MSAFVNMVEEQRSDNIIAKKSELKSPEPFLGCQSCGKKFFSDIAQKRHMASYHPPTNNEKKNENIDTSFKTFFEASPMTITSKSGSDGVEKARSESIKNLNPESTNSMASSKPVLATEIDFSQMIEDINNFADSKKVPMDIGLNVDITPDTSFTEVSF